MPRVSLLIFTFSSLFALSQTLNAKETYGPYPADVIKVIDGDTIKVNVHIWPNLTQEINLRLAGINTPEKRGRVSDCEKKAGQKATEFTQRWLKGITRVTITDVELGKFAGRALGRISKKGEDLGEALIKNGHAKPYDGGKREPWC